MPSTAAATIAERRGVAVGADADRDDRLAEGDDDDQPVALGEVPGHEPPAVDAEEVAGRPCRATRASDQSADLGAAVE